VNVKNIIIIILASLAVGIGRTMVPGHGLSWPGTYEAFAHIWVGMLICSIFSKDAGTKVAAIWCLGLLSVFELLMFFSRSGQ
jgi:hypothetical protein